MLAITDHWFRSAPPSTERARRDPERRAELPAARATATATCSPSGSSDTLAELEGERRDLAATAEWITAQGGVAYLAHPYWTGATPGTLELPDTVSGIEVFNAGCELELGRGLSTVHWDELLDAGRPCYALATDDSHHPGLRLRPRLDVGPGRADGGGRARGAPHADASTAASGPRITSVVAGGGSVEVQCDPCQLGQGRLRGVERRRRQRRPPRLPLRRRDPRHDAGRAHHGRAARPARDRPVRAGRGRRRPRRQRPGRTHCDPGSLAGGRARRAGPRAVRPARDRRRHHRRRDRERGGARRASASPSSTAATSAAPPRARRRS